MSAAKRQCLSGGKILRVLDLLLRHFPHGLTQADICKACDISPTACHTYVATLTESGFAETIPETGRVRPSHRLARAAFEILQALDSARTRTDESINRIRGGA
jgi:DNA-binding IclR family transcriptional regulator